MAGLIGFFAAVSIGSARPDMAVFVTGKGLVVMVLGGLGSLPGAIVGGLVLGVLEFEATWFLGSTYRDIIAFGILFLILVFRPQGFLGERPS
jgi:branched-chain amino acid transport system permease protein